MSGASLDGERMLVTGGGQCLGAAASRVLASAGAPGVGADRAESIARESTRPASAEVMVQPTAASSWP